MRWLAPTAGHASAHTNPHTGQDPAQGKQGRG